jgi:copper chaperone CopZ
MGHYVHDVPGRLRVKNPLLKGKHWMAEEVGGLLRQIGGILSSNINTITGSVVINYDPKAISSKDILSVLRNARYYDPSRAVTNDQYIHSAVTKAGHAVKKALFGTFVEKAFEGSALSYLAILI